MAALRLCLALFAAALLSSAASAQGPAFPTIVLEPTPATTDAPRYDGNAAPALVPTPAPAYSPAPNYGPGPGGPAVAYGPAPIAPPAPLFHNVRYKDPKNIAPCAVPQVVLVRDPCLKSCDKCDRCVAVQVCMPHGCTKISRCKDGSRVKYDFGKYEVEIVSRNGEVVVDYDN